MRSGVAFAATRVVVHVVVLGGALACAPAVVAQDPVHADEVVDLRSLLALAESGDARAAFILGARFAAGRGGTRDDSEAVRWFQRAAEQGLAEAQYNLGIMYANGRGVPRDMTLAARWYRLAAEQGIPEAQYNLGTLYGIGAGVPRDERMAADWLHRAADAELPHAQYNLGVLYEHGRGVRLDGRAAMVWYQRAAEQGFEPARERLDALMAKLRVTEVPAVDVAGAEPLPESRPASRPASRPESRPTSRPVAVAPAEPEPVALDWISRADPSGYTLQILSDTNEASVLRFIERHFGDDDKAGYFTAVKNGITWHSVVYGEFGNYDAAKAAVERLPAALQRGKPWVRKIGIVQQSMK